MSSRRPHHHGGAPASSSSSAPPRALVSFPSSASSSASAGPTPTHASAAALASLPLTGSSFFPLSDPAALHNEQERLYYLAEDHKMSLTVAQMDRCQELTDSMLSILDSFDDKLCALESSMLPIHKGTQALMTAQRNLDATLIETDKIILHYRIATESESSVEAHRLNAIDYVSYLEWVERIHLSINFFTKNKDKLDRGSSGAAGPDGLSSSSSASSSAGSSGGQAHLGGHSSDVDKYLRKLKELNKRVMAECEGEFERVLGASSKHPLDLSRTGWPLPATMIVESAAAAQQGSQAASPTSAAVASNAAAAAGGGGAQLIPFQLVPALSVRELSALATRMTMAGNHNYFGILLAQRSGFLRTTLKKVFNEELKFLTNQNHAAAAGANAAAGGSAGAVAAAATPPPMLMQMRGSIIRASSAGAGNSLLGPSDSLLSSSSAGSTAASISSGASGPSSHLYQKRSHKSVFYLEFFLKLLELEHTFLVQVLTHIFNQEEMAANGLQQAAGGAGSTAGQAQESMLVQGALGGKTSLAQHTSAALSGSSLLKDLATQASTGNLTVFWGQEAYDQLYANIVDSPLEYFRKKIDQNTYLKGESLMGFGRSIQNVFHLGGGGGGGGGGSGGSGGSHAGGGSGGGGGAGKSDSGSSAGGSSGGGVFTSLTSGSALPLGTTLSNKILILLDVLEQLNTLLPRYRILLKKHTHFDRLVEFQTSVTTLARKSLQEYREYMLEYTERAAAGTKGGGVALKDGTIYTLTVETLNFIKRLYEYRRVIDATSTLLDKHHHTNAAASAAAASEKAGGGAGAAAETKHAHDSLLSDGSFPSLSSFAAESTMAAVTSFLLSGLESNMETKARAYKHGSLSAIFLLNNFHYVTKFIKKNTATFGPLTAGGAAAASALAGIGSASSASASSGGSAGRTGTGTGGMMVLFLDRYERLVHLAMKSYRTASWEKIVTTALESSEIQELYRGYASSPLSSSAHKNARKAIKGKFSIFNAHFEEMFNAQRHYSIPDSDLRSQLRNDNVELILPSYKLLYTTFVGVEFSTNPAKYTKYTPAVLEAMLNKFFDEEAL